MTKALLTMISLVCAQGIFIGAESSRMAAEDWVPAPDKTLSIATEKKLDDATYQAEKAKLLEGVKIEQLKSSIDLEFSCGILAVIPNSPAQQLGLEINDRVLRCGKYAAAPNFWQKSFQLFVSEGGGEMVVERRGKQVSFQVSQGRLGIFFKHNAACRLASIYATDEAKGKPWDDDMLVACISVDYYPDLAETALSHSREKGYDGPLRLATEALLAHAHTKLDVALSLGIRALKQLKPAHARGFAWQMAVIASATGRMKTASELIASYKLQDYFPNWADLTAASLQLKKIVGQAGSPAAVAQERPYLELREDIRMLRPFTFKEADAIRRGGQVGIKLQFGQFSPSVWGPRVRNGQLSMKVKTEPLMGPNALNLPLVVQLENWDRQTQTADGQELHIHPDGTLICKRKVGDQPPLMVGKSPRIARGEETAISFTCIDGLLEISVDEQRVFIGPLITPMAKSTSLTWGMLRHPGASACSAISWRSIGEKAEGEPNTDGLSGVRRLMTEQKWELALEALTARGKSTDWNVDRLMTELLNRDKKYKELSVSARRWAEASMEPEAWLAWAWSSLNAESSSMDEVLATLKKNVPDVSHWIYSDYVRALAAQMRQAGRSKECIELLRPLEHCGDSGPMLSLYWCYLDVENWGAAQGILEELFERGVMNRYAETSMRFIDAAVAIRSGQPTRSLAEIRERVNGKRMSKHLMFSLALWGKEIEPGEMDKKTGSFHGADLWNFYHGLMAFAQRDDKLAKEKFDLVIQKHPASIEALYAHQLNDYLSGKKQGGRPEQPAPGAWPYTSASYKPIKLPKPSSEAPAEPLPQGDNNF